MSWVLIRNEDGKYVARPGVEHSYTHKLEAARTWPTQEAAQQEACSNERTASVEELFGSE